MRLGLPHFSPSSASMYYTEELKRGRPGNEAIFNGVYLRSRELLHSAICSPSSVVQCAFLDASYLYYTFVGYNTIYGNHLIKKYHPEDFLCADLIRSYKSHFGCFSPYKDIINTVSTAQFLSCTLLPCVMCFCTPLAGVYIIRFCCYLDSSKL